MKERKWSKFKRLFGWWLANVSTAISRLANATSGGDCRCSVSGRVGHFSRKKKNSRYWRNMERLIDHTFEPIDGEGHCLQAMGREAGFKHGHDVGLVVLTMVAAIGCLLIWLPIRLLALAK